MHVLSQRNNSVKLLLAFLLTTLGTLAGQRQTLVNVVVDMTPEGRKAVHPTPDHPAYYYPIVGGYNQEGQAIAGDKQPKQNELLHLAAVELAKQGYLVVNPGKIPPTPPPDIILVFHWGPINPETFDLNDVFGGDVASAASNTAMAKPDASGASNASKLNPEAFSSLVTMNNAQMLNMLVGNTLPNIHASSGYQAVIEAAQEDRYFIMVTAYDFPATVRQKKAVLLWQAKMSVPSAGVAFDDVTPTLIAAGGPLFGRETTVPQHISLPVTPEGRVIVGTSKVVHDDNAAGSSR
jgi:hypothetical protein